MAEFNVVSFEWYGEQVTEKVIYATRRSMDSVMADCVVEAKNRVPVKTAILQGSIQMRPTVLENDQLTGYWGSFSVKYARWVEEGTGEHVILPRNKQALYWPGAAHPVRMVFHPGTKARPYLVPSAELIYPSLPFRIQAEISWGAGA